MSDTTTAFASIAASPFELGIGGEGEGGGADCKGGNGDSHVRRFFRDVWQKQPAIYRTASEKRGPSILSMGCDDVADLLHHLREHADIPGASRPMFFRSGTPIIDPDALYASNPHAAYLDGCSVVINHADFHHASLARMCDELQQTFPHVYCNTYLTPPASSAVKAHADDRDVLVMQLIGKKRWRVYKRVPVPFPFDQEQVGKYGNVVDASVLEGGLCFGDKEVTLHPGDVLYMPRGFVHEATTNELSRHEPSFHATFAIATHDWCASAVVAETIQNMLQSEPKYRVALPVGPCRDYEECMDERSSLKSCVEGALSAIQSNITSEIIEQRLRAKYRIHNQHAESIRGRLQDGATSRKRKADDDQSSPVVGKDAAARLGLQSIIRVSTPEERESVQMEEGRLRGLTVREKTMPALLQVLSAMKSADASATNVVSELRDLLSSGSDEDAPDASMVCDFTLLSFAKCCVELGALAVATP
ncbi:hypothetical protein ACHAXT_004888 [Thalassiosira profunda]